MEPLASYICNHPHITGFKFHNSSHTITLFAYDIILMLTDAESSLTSVHQVLKMFNCLSYHKVNETKSYILGLNVPSHIQHKLVELYP